MRVLFTIVILFSTNFIFAQTQIADFLGQAQGDQFGSAVSFSAQGNRVAVGAWRNDEFGVNAGQVYIYEDNNDDWEIAIGALGGEASNDRFGYAVALSADGSRVAIGAPNKPTTAGVASGQVYIYQENNGTWQEVGTPIGGQNVSENFGTSISISANGQRVAIRTFTEGLGSSLGNVRIYEEGVGAIWTQIGTDIPANDGFDTNDGMSLSADGTRIAISRPSASGATGAVDIYEEVNGVWQILSTFTGTVGGELFGQSISLSADGTVLAVGIPGSNIAATAAGEVFIYEEENGIWSMIQSLSGTSIVELFGSAVALSDDGSHLVVGAPRKSDNGTDAGQVSIFVEDDGNWILSGNNINGSTAFQRYGTQVGISADGTRIVIGANNDDSNGTNAGLVHIYETSTCIATTGVDIVEACIFYTWIDGNDYTASNNTATFVLTNAQGCDSIVTLNLTINNPTDLDATLTNSGGTLTANESDASYQWVNCGNGFQPITGATEQSYTPTTSGVYAVEISKGGCQIISGCQSVNVTNTKDILQEAGISIFPNPTKMYIQIDGIEQLENAVICNTLGQPILNVQEDFVDVSNLPRGVYYMKALVKEKQVIIPLIKQ